MIDLSKLALNLPSVQAIPSSDYAMFFFAKPLIYYSAIKFGIANSVVINLLFFYAARPLAGKDDVANGVVIAFSVLIPIAQACLLFIYDVSLVHYYWNEERLRLAYKELK